MDKKIYEFREYGGEYMKFRRKIYDRMLQWKAEAQGRTAILIEGARRVGKSFVVREFAEQEYKSFIFIDFSILPKAVRDIFENDVMDMTMFFSRLSVFYGVKLHERESLIVFDEVQLFPQARQLIKHLVADGRYDYVETGSLITLRQNVADILIPSEEEHLTMYPMDFEEYLWAMGDETTFEYIRTCFKDQHPLGDAIHRKVMNLFRQYMLVGGMPQSVAAYQAEQDFEAADAVKRRILNLYRQDVTKFAKGYESKVLSIFDGIPEQLSRHEKTYKLSTINKAARFRMYEDAFIWLKEARVVNTAFNSNDPKVGLSLNQDRMTMKCYLGDTGLLFSQAFSENEVLEQNVYRSILFDKLSLNEGMFFENMVAQQLVQAGHKLYFYSRWRKEPKKECMEIDFLIRKGGKICPIEVKSSNYRRHSSIDKLIQQFSASLGDKFIIYGKDVSRDGEIICLPIYMTMLL